MNVQPGDLARIVHPERDGSLVSVLYAAPIGRRYELPDGQIARPASSHGWICESLGAPFDVQVVAFSGSGARHLFWRLARYAWVEDCWLRPIRSDGVSNSEVRELYSNAEGVAA